MAKVLIVDDEAVIITQLEEIVVSAGHVVAGSACSGKEAVKLAQALLPDLVIMDIVMPGDMDGVEAAKKIQADSDIPIVFITGFPAEALMRKIAELKPYGYIQKPFQTQQVTFILQIALEKSAMEQALKRVNQDLRAVLEKETRSLVQAKSKLEQELGDRRRVGLDQHVHHGRATAAELACPRVGEPAARTHRRRPRALRSCSDRGPRVRRARVRARRLLRRTLRCEHRPCRSQASRGARRTARASGPFG